MKAAVLHEVNKPLVIEDVSVPNPGPREVLIRTRVAGLCHSDLHFMEGLYPHPLPAVLGHESAGVVEKVGSDVHYVKPGDHVVTCLSVFCGTCDNCTTGRTVLCTDTTVKMLPGQSNRLSWARSEKLNQFLNLSSFAEQMLVHENAIVKIRKDMPLELAALTSCGVPTGFGSAVKAGEVKPGDTTIVYGIGGVGVNALQGASIAGARYVIAVDPVAFKRESALGFGATHAVATTDEARALALELTWGVGADQAIVTLGVVTEDVVSAAFAAIRKRGTVVLTGLAGPGAKTVNVSGFELALFEKRLQGALFGSSNPFDDIPRILDLYRAGKLKLSELITTRYTLDQVNQGYEDMMAGRNIRGVLIHES